MDYKKLFHKIIALLSSPGKTWTEISEGGEERNILDSFVYPLIGLCSMAEFIGAFWDVTSLLMFSECSSQLLRPGGSIVRGFFSGCLLDRSCGKALVCGFIFQKCASYLRGLFHGGYFCA